ncbi:MAG: prolipoprotein diacylglyceryl transferase [Angelakisella sp.]|jgi:phosphatidylglycerol:prolipoprotein diacylglycerol transferase|nr:prolipoprotein diacylglyceryl transferase [Angelakisella sp.]MCI9528893.1 prolipoprotein diacylglyceryl transferase [Angelakisella sp.]
MAEIISFPGLGLSFEVSRVAFSIGSYNIYWYGITFALGFLVGMYYFHLRARSLGIHPYDGLDVLLWAVIGGVVGARAYFVIFQWEMYRDNLLKIFAFREGGLAIYGGVIGAVVVGWIACRVKKTPFLPVLDGGLTGLLLAQAVGRWGNFFNCEAFGSNTTLPWGMTSDTISRYLFNMADTLAAQGMLVDPTVPVHPTFFYEFVWNLLGFLLLAFVLTPRRRYDGQVSLGYMAWYGLGRFFIEGLRTDSLMLGSYRVSQLLALALCAGSVLLMAVLWLRTRKVPAVLYVDTEASRQRMAKVDAELSKNGGGGGDAPAGDEPLSGDSGDDVVVSTADGCEGTGPSPEGAGEAEEASTESAGEAEEASTESVGEAEEASTESAGEAEGTSTESAGEAEEASTESIKETEKASDKDAGEVVENAPNGGEETETPENTAK